MNGKPLTVAVASDHAGLEMKERIREALAGWGHSVVDLGTGTAEAVDYPDFAEAVAVRISGRTADLGVLVCGTGVGMSISANKFPGVRAALLYDDFTARASRLHNDANVAVFGSRTMPVEAAVARLRIFLTEPFEQGRHARRLEKIDRIEKRLAPRA